MILSFLSKSTAFVAACLLTSVAVAQNGSLDLSFNSTGKTVLDFSGGEDQLKALLVQPDGKILAAGWASDPVNHINFGVCRYLPNGTLDASFATGGKLSLDFATEMDDLTSMALQPDGKIVLAGFMYEPGLELDPMQLARLNPDGSLDPTFSGDGKLQTTVPGYKAHIRSVLVQPDGKILAGGVLIDSDYRSFLVRYLPNGDLDNSFGTGGMRIGNTDLRGIHTITLLPDGKILATTDAQRQGEPADFALLRYLPDGTPDAGFGTAGLAYLDLPDISGDGTIRIAVQPDGKILLARILYDDSPYMLGLARLNANGTFDGTFGTNGFLPVEVDKSQDDFMNVDIKLQPDGKILLASSAYTPALDLDRFLLMRLLPDGSPDNGFGSNGRQLEALGSNDSYAFSMALQPDGKIVLGGLSYSTGEAGNFAIARYLSGLVLGTLTFSESANAVLVYPNPVNDFATLEYTLAEPETLRIDLYDMEGKLVKTLSANQKQEAGTYQQALDVSGLPSGNYLLSLRSARGQVSVKLLK